jgi:hypothetical protein
LPEIKEIEKINIIERDKKIAEGGVTCIFSRGREKKRGKEGR